ncbi:MAG: PqqD family protein [Gammaproteobacteria bacterium]
MAALRSRDDLLSERFDDALILVDVGAGEVHELNSTAAWLWDHLDGCKDAGELAKLVCEYFAVSMEIAQADTDMILAQLLYLNLLVNEEDGHDHEPRPTQSAQEDGVHPACRADAVGDAV